MQGFRVECQAYQRKMCEKGKNTSVTMSALGRLVTAKAAREGWLSPGLALLSLNLIASCTCLWERGDAGDGGGGRWGDLLQSPALARAGVCAQWVLRETNQTLTR